MPLDATPSPAIDVEAFARDLDELAEELRSTAGEEDVRHLRKLERWGRLATAFGYATAWIVPNPISAFALSFGRYVRWTGVAHPVAHRGYDRIEGVARERRSNAFARGWRRVLDWFDWLEPAAWHEEHNLLHHYRLNEETDPDLVERNLQWFRESSLPRWLRLAIVPLMAASWKWVYYAPNSTEMLQLTRARRAGEAVPSTADALRARWSDRGLASFWPRTSPRLWLRSWLPYGLVTFVLIPLLFLPLSLWAATSVLLNSLLAEVMTNLHAFITIVPNHSGADLYRFEGRPASKPEFYLRQVLGSANYRTGGDLNDIMHGWLNYQIEHHLWPDMSLLQYRRAQPRVREICERHGVAYVQESVWTRCRKTLAIFLGEASLRPWPPAGAQLSAPPRTAADRGPATVSSDLC